MNFWTSVYSRTYPTAPRKVWDERVRFSVGIAAPAPRIQRTFGPTSALGPTQRCPASSEANAFDLALASLARSERRHCCPRSENPMNFWTSVYSRTYPTAPRKVWDERVRFSVGIAAPAPRVQRTFGPTSALGPTQRCPASSEANAFDLALASLARSEDLPNNPPQVLRRTHSIWRRHRAYSAKDLPNNPPQVLRRTHSIWRWHRCPRAENPMSPATNIYPRTPRTTPRKVWDERVRFGVGIAAPALRYDPPDDAPQGLGRTRSIWRWHRCPRAENPMSPATNIYPRTPRTTPRKVWDERIRFGVGIAAPALRTPRTTPRKVWDERIRFGVGIAAPALRTPRTTPRKVWDERVRFSVGIAAPAPRIQRTFGPTSALGPTQRCHASSEANAFDLALASLARSENPMNFWTSVYSRTYPTAPRKVWDERVRFSVGIAAPAPRIQRTFGPTSALGPTQRCPASSEANAFDLAVASLAPLRASALGPTQRRPASFEANAFALASASLPPR
ncbi:hypothetical protein C8F04DRAFT_1332512 [Mycena alexandri]|uniref:Uncharacterized protein n=1 Tax=Mycena alexandri TaxID=1745969 RepID=A0AAD6RYG6_9AGAR|nr:hypothetical protein C8F04DRAFT_1332512 [Mycena alexandri]